MTFSCIHHSNFTDVVLYDGRQATSGASEYKTDLTTHPNRFISAQFARILAGQGHFELAHKTCSHLHYVFVT